MSKNSRSKRLAAERNEWLHKAKGAVEAKDVHAICGAFEEGQAISQQDSTAHDVVTKAANEMRDALVAIGRAVVTKNEHDDVYDLARVLTIVIVDLDARNFETQEVGDLILAIGNAGVQLQNEQLVWQAAKMICRMSHCRIWEVEELSSALLAMGRSVARKGVCCRHYAQAVAGVAEAIDRTIFSGLFSRYAREEEVRSMLLAMGETAAEEKCCDAIRWTAVALGDITCEGRTKCEDGAAVNCLCSEEVQTLLIDMMKTVVRMKHGDGIWAMTNLINKITSSWDTRELFGNTAMRNALAESGSAAAELKHGDAVFRAANAICNITYSENSQQLFGTTDVRDALVAMGKAATQLRRSDAESWTALAIADIARNTKNRKLFGTTEVRDVLVAMGNRLSRTAHSEGMSRTASAVASITANSATVAVFATPQVRNMLVALGNAAIIPHDGRKYAIGNLGLIEHVACAIYNIADDSKKLFGTKEVRDTLVAMRNALALKDDDYESWNDELWVEDRNAIIFVAAAINTITKDDDNKNLFSTNEVRDALVAMSHLVVTFKDWGSIELMVSGFCEIAKVKQNQKLFATEEVRNVLVALGNAAVNERHGDAIYLMACAITNITCSNESNKKLFGTQEVRDVLVAMGNVAAELKRGRWNAVEWTASAFDEVASENQKLFGTDDVRDALVAMGNAAADLTHDAAVQKTASAMSKVTCNDNDIQKLFGTLEVRNALVAMGNAAVEAQNADAVHATATALSNITTTNFDKLFDVEEVRDVLVSMGSIVVQQKRAVGIISVAKVIGNITCEEHQRALFCTEEVRDVLVAMGHVALEPKHEGGDAIKDAVAGAVANITARVNNRKLFVTTEMLEVLKRMREGASSPLVKEKFERLMNPLTHVDKTHRYHHHHHHRQENPTETTSIREEEDEEEAVDVKEEEEEQEKTKMKAKAKEETTVHHHHRHLATAEATASKSDDAGEGGEEEAVPNCRLAAIDDITGDVKDYRGALRFPPGFAPKKSCAESMKDAISLFAKDVPQLQCIVEDSLRVAESRLDKEGALTTLDQCFTVVLYTYDLGIASEKDDGCDNFYFVFNKMLRLRDNVKLKAIRPYLFYLKQALDAIPPEPKGTVFYRGLPKSALPLLRDYETGGKVHWSGFTSLSRHRKEAEKFTKEDGIVLEITTVSAVCIAPHSMFPEEDEVLLRPNTVLVVSSGTDIPAFADNRVITLGEIKDTQGILF